MAASGLPQTANLENRLSKALLEIATLRQELALAREAPDQHVLAELKQAKYHLEQVLGAIDHIA